MKAFIVFACFLACSTAFSVHKPAPVMGQREEMDLAFIKEHFDKFVEFLKQYDPVDVESQTLFDIMGMYVKLNKLHIEGFSNMKADLSVDITFPQFKVKFEFDLPAISGSVEKFESTLPFIFGEGGANFEMKNGRVSVEIVYDLMSGLKPTQVMSSVESANFKITGFNNDEVLSQTITEAVNNFFNNTLNSAETHKIIGTVVDTIINIVLEVMKNQGN
ncbi:hypothetical protein PPYR_09181 [Photinus pyralis]|uniref:Lipid-binding serum glycoprotein N-terminal domain-containing protein n=1 Tax=Photinus pyralis TaxID=7054 RepID=A0A1Y1KTL8_PHOPY|nr:uncharacterized protein LOC116171760 [Photinus pyralis]KAB0798188.1 hypothetical protein PPYR_09181 [Photinus pyralis]